MGSKIRKGMRVRVEAEDTHYGKVLNVKNGEALVRWEGSGAISAIDVLDCHEEPTP